MFALGVCVLIYWESVSHASEVPSSLLNQGRLLGRGGGLSGESSHLMGAVA